MRTIPDLRPHHNEFTIEHCSVLLESLGRLLDLIHDEGMSEIAMSANAYEMHKDLTEIMSEQQLCVLFESELGKGLIIGTFFSHCILPQYMEGQENETDT